MLTIANQLLLLAQSCRFHTLIGMPVAFAATANGKIRNAVVIRAKHTVIAENLIPKGVHANQRYANGFRSYPILFTIVSLILLKNCKQTCKTSLSSKFSADGRPSRVEKAILPPVNGEISENSRVHWAIASLPGSIGAFSGNLKVERQEPLKKRENY